MRILPRAIDERFLAYRLKSTSIAGIVGGCAAIGLFAYRYYFEHTWNWDLFAISLTIVGAKLAAMTWYFLSE
jgi:hypothetical protein